MRTQERYQCGRDVVDAGQWAAMKSVTSVVDEAAVERSRSVFERRETPDVRPIGRQSRSTQAPTR
jgi:hypothetical protein